MKQIIKKEEEVGVVNGEVPEAQIQESRGECWELSL